MYRSVIDVVKDWIDPSSQPHSKCHRPLTHTEASVSSDVTWLVRVGKWLPGSWSEADIADKAVKSDNATVDFRPWHRQIQLILPCSDATIGRMERLATRRWRHNVCRSFFAYIKATYGSHWRQTLMEGATVGDSSNVTRKRSRPSFSKPLKRQKGGWREKREKGWREKREQT